MKIVLLITTVMAVFANGQSLDQFIPGSRTLVKIADRTQIPELSGQSTARGQQIWDLEEYRGRIYIGMGDYGGNTGPIDIVAYDPASNTFETSLNGAPTEATEYIRNINDNLYVTMTDARGWTGPAFVGVQAGSNSWQQSATLSSTAHTFDVTEFGGRIYVTTGDWQDGGSHPGATVPANETARVYSSGDFGNTWQLEVASNLVRFYHIGSDATTIYTCGNGGSYYKKDGVWNGVSTSGNFRPVTLNGTMRMIPADDGASLYKLSGSALVAAESKPFTADNFFANNISYSDTDLPYEVFWMLGSPAGSTAVEIYATTDFVTWVPIAQFTDQGANASIYQSFVRVAYYDNTLYLGTTNGHLYALQDIFDFDAAPLATITSGYYHIQNIGQPQFLSDNDSTIAYTHTTPTDSTFWQINQKNDLSIELIHLATGNAIHANPGSTFAHTAVNSENTTSGQWFGEFVSDTIIRLRNSADATSYLYVNNSDTIISHGAIETDWVSAQWKLTPATPRPHMSVLSYTVLDTIDGTTLPDSLLESQQHASVRITLQNTGLVSSTNLTMRIDTDESLLTTSGTQILGTLLGQSDTIVDLTIQIQNIATAQHSDIIITLNDDFEVWTDTISLFLTPTVVESSEEALKSSNSAFDESSNDESDDRSFSESPYEASESSNTTALHDGIHNSEGLRGSLQMVHLTAGQFTYSAQRSGMVTITLFSLTGEQLYRSSVYPTRGMNSVQLPTFTGHSLGVIRFTREQQYP
ncbi:MAG: PQQ-binding-like beta-propeller repeat protein [Fibrobacterales bacterium]